MGADPILLTLRLAATTTALLLSLALPLAWWIAQGRGSARALVQALVALPLVLPPTVLGYYLLVGLGPLTAAGRFWLCIAGRPLAFSFAGLLAGSLVYSLPFAVQPLVAGFQAVEPGYLETAAGLGRSPWDVILGVVVPQARRSVLAAAVLTFTHTVGEFGVVLMIGGNIPGQTQTLSIALFDQFEDGNYAAANLTALLLGGLSLAALLLLYLRPALPRTRRSDALG